MKVITLLAFITIARAKVFNRNDCEGIILNNISHDKEILKDKIHNPYQLSMDYITNTLYFSYTANDGDVFKMAYLNLNTNTFGTIGGITSPFASTVDETSHKAYFGGADGIYQLEASNSATKLDITHSNIWQLFYKNGLYFTTYPEEEAYVYKDNKVRKLNELGETKVTVLAVDKRDNIFYSNTSGLYVHNVHGDNTFIGRYVANGFTSDSNGKIYFSTPTGIFKIEEDNLHVVKMGRVNNIYGLAVESDGSLIYSEEDAIVRLKSTGKNCGAGTEY